MSRNDNSRGNLMYRSTPSCTAGVLHLLYGWIGIGVGQCIGFSFESSFRDIWKDIVSVSYHCLRGLSNRIVPVFSFFLLKNYVSCIVLLPIFSHFLPQNPSCFPFPVVIFFPSPFSRSISEDLGLGITSALKMEEKYFLAAETFPNEDVF